MANIYQLWDNTVLNSANATPEQLEQKRNELKTRFESVARGKGVASKDIYATIDKFDQYSRQKTTTRDDGLTPDEREAAQDDGSTILDLNKGALKEGAKAIKDLGLGIVSSVPRVVGDLAQTWSDVGENDPSELPAQLARKAYDASEDIKSNYSEVTKKAKKDFWSPAGLAMGIGENLGQVALSASLVGGASKGAMALSKGSKAWGLGAGLTTGMGLGYGQGYGQGKENALEKINNTSNEDLYAGVVNQFNEWNSGGAKKGSKPEIVSLYEEAEGDLNKMKDLMAEDAGAWAGILTAVTAPIAMGATAFMNRGAINQIAAQGVGNPIVRNLAFQTGARDSAEFARRVAARDAATGLGGKIAANASIARQGLKIAGKQSGLQTVEEGAQEWGEGYFAAGAGSLARGDKGVLSDKDWDEVNQQGLQGAAIGGLMGGGGSLLTMRDAQNTGIVQAKARTELPKQYQDSFNAFEDAKQAEAQAQATHEANPTPESKEILAAATSERLKANNQFNQYDAAFKQSFTEQEQQDLLANDLKGIAARAKLAKLAEEAKQAELNNKAQQEALVKAQRDNLVKGLAAFVGNEEVLLNKVNQLGLDDTQKELLLNDVFAERKKTKTNPQQPNGQAKTPLELAVDEHFDAKGNRKPSVMSQDVADKHKLSLNELVPAIAKRMNDIKIQKAQAEKQAKVDAFNKTREQESTQDVKREKLTEKQQLENTLAEFAAENDTDSMLSLLDGYENKAEADKLFNNAFKTVETRAKEAEKATKAKEAEVTKQEQAKQKQSAFSTDMSALYESNPNATYNDWKAIGKKYGVTSAIDLASAWANARVNKPKQKDEQKPKNTETLALPAPDTVMVADAQGNVIPTTENNVPKKPRSNDFSVPSGLKVDVSNVENTRSDLGKGSYIGSAYIVRQDGQPFPTEQVAQQALKNKATKKPRRKNEPTVSKDTHSVVPIEGGFAIAPVEAVTQEQPNTQADDALVGDYAHTQLPDAVATVSKTEKGYDINWGDEVQSVTGKNAVEKTQAALKKENFNKKNPDNDNGGVPVEPVVPKPVSPMGGNSAPQAKPKTDAEQIASAFEGIGKGGAEKAHISAIERIKDGEEIVYKQPAAIERAKQDDRYQVEINDKGHAVVKNIKDLNGEWVKKNEPIAAEATHIENGKVEEVTNEIIRESLVKVDDKPVNGRTMSLKEAKQWLLDSIDVAIAVAPKELNSKAQNWLQAKKEGVTPKENLDDTYYVVFDVPNDGRFKVLNSIKHLQIFKEKIQKTKGFTENQKPTKPFSAPSENLPETTIMGFLNDGELENAYFFAENQKKPIRFTLSNKKEPIAYFLTEPVDLGNNITGFVGISTDPMSKSKRWLVIEEKSRTSIGFEEISKQAAIKSAKARLSALKKEDLDRLSSTIKPINKTDQEMSVEWLAKNNIKTDDEKTEQQSTTKPKKAIPTLEDVISHLKGIRNLTAESFKDAKTKAEIKNALEDYLDKVIPDSVSAKEFKAITDELFNKLVDNYSEEDYKSSGKLAHPIPEIAKRDNQPTNNSPQQADAPVKWFATELRAQEWINKQKSGSYKIVKVNNNKFEIYAADENNAAPSKDAVKDILVGKNPEGKDLYEDSRGVRYYKQGGAKVFEDVAISGKGMDLSNRTDEYRIVEEVAARQPKQPSKKESLLIQIDDELDAALDDLANVFKEQGKRLSSGVDPVILGKVLVFGAKASSLYIAKGAVKFAVWAENMINGLSSKGVQADVVKPYLKQMYIAAKVNISPEIRKQMDKEDDVYDFDFAILNQAEDETNKLGSDKLVFKNIDELKKWAAFNANNKKTPISFQRIVGVDDSVYFFKNKQEWENDISENTSLVFVNENQIKLKDTQNVTTPSQANGTNAGERNQTPESSQVQRASEPRLTQDNPQKRDDGVSANSGGRSDGRNNSNESGEGKTRSQQSDVASTGSKSPKLGDSTRSTESSDGTNLRNYRIQPNELNRTGSWRATAEQNVQIVELVKSIVAENRAATPEEKSLLTKFTGWGASEIANGIFPNQYGSYKDANWKALGERLEAALSPEEYAQAKRTTQYAHYTSEPIIRSVYAALSRFGFNGGSMVEPGMGVGLFNGLMPDAMANNSQYTGIEYDTITGNIAKLLYPDSNVIVGDFTQTKLPKNFFDVAVGNPPFGNIKIQSDPEYKKQGFLLHDYFFAKTIDRVKEGGLLVFVTSKGTMDKANDRARKYLSERADLVGAIRLPQTAFKDNAGTEVVTDVIFLRKRTAEQEPAGEAWGGLKEITTPQGNASINEYFANHPKMILGKSALTSSQFKANEYTVEPIAGSDIETLFSEAINNLPENIYKPQQGSKAEQAAVQRRDYDPKIKKEGGIYVADDGVLMQVSNGQGSPLTQKQNSKHELVDLKPKEKEWLKDYVGVRDALKQAQYDQLQDNSNWQQSLDALNKAYDAFVKKHGFMLDHTISERENEDGSVTVTKRFKNKSIMGLDAESALINALEQINGDNSISKAPALLGRVINKPSTPVITSTQDAMFVVFNELGRFDLAKVAKLINKSEKDVVAELGDSIYEDPSQSWTTSDDYLSGNVVRKLKEAEQAARLNPKYQRNVTALKAVQPPALAPQDINVQLGGAWIPASDVTQFASEILSERFRVNYSPLTGQWSVEGNANYSSEWGIPAKNSKDILEAVLNNRQIKVTYLDANKKTHTDTEKTEKANDIAKKMRQSFKKWLWEDVSRTERLVTYYNEHFNNIAPRVFDGQHLTLPGVSSRFDLRPHQKRAIWRTIQQGDVYYAHAVGAGKAQPLDAKILTPNGWKNMGDIHVGDEVITQSGVSTTVDAVFPQGKKEIFKVLFSDGSSTECCDEHLWLTQTYAERNSANHAKRLNKNWDCASPKVRSLAEIRSTLLAPHLNAKNHSIPTVEPVQFPHKPIAIDPYLMGVLLGDGGMSHASVTITSMDEEIISGLVLPENIELRRNEAKGKCPTWVLRMKKQSGYGVNRAPNPAVFALEELGLMGKTSKDKFIPVDYLFNDVDSRIALLQGLLDTDGCVSKKGHSVYYYTISKRLANDVTSLVQSLGGTVKTTTKTPKYKYKNEVKTGALAYALCICFPQNITPFRLTRKLERVKPKSKYKPIRYIVAVEPVGLKEAQCIRVVDESHLYITDDFVVTHNTFSMIASGMEERRLGLVKKPMYVVPNHMLAQFSKEFLELYPMANIMVADEANFHTHNRRKFVAQAALNNPDAIVITHSAFGRIGMSSEYSSKFIKNQIDDWQIALQEVGSDERITRKQIERRIEQLENKLKALLDGEKDQLLNFEELGVDRLYIDEGHEFRKLDFPTNRGNIKGIDPSGSQKSMDLYMKVEYLRGKNPNRSLVMASGTPVTNTMGELFTVQRFFNPSQLEEDGDSSFDAWSAHYGEVVDGLEQNAAGGYETVSRFAKFVNVPELMSRVRYFMDILTSNQLGDLVQRPDVVGGGRQVIVTPAPDGYKDYQKDLERRIKAIRDRKAPPKPGDDIILSVIGDGRFSAIDMRFVDSTLPSDPNSKLNRMLDDLISAYHETANNEYVTSGVIDENKGSSLMLFTDIGLGEQSAKNRGFDMKAWIEKRLVEGGVKREHIAFMRDNKAHSKKEKLFDDMRQGKKRILIGGKDMETGVNAQKRLTHLFHLDAPWFPASVEQREGRIIRQGNQNKIVAIRAYASKGSYDSTMWGMNSRKARFIEQAMSGDSSIRNMEDVSEASAFEMAAALASGDERYLKLAGLKGDVERLGRLYSAHIDEQKRFAREKAHLESQNKHSTSKIEQINEAIAKRKPIKAGEFLANVGKQSFDSREDFSKALFDKFKEVAESYKADEVELGSIAGFPIVYNGVELRGGNFAADLRVDLPIDAEPLAIFPIDPAYSVSGIATRAVNQTNALERELVSRKSSIEQNTKDLARIGRRIGASFPEMAELNEKQQALNELEQELNAESKADDGLEQSIPQDTDSKPKFSQSSAIGDRTITQVRDKLISRFGKRIIDLLESKGILKIHQSMSELPKGVLGIARGTEDAAYYNGVVHLIADNLTDEAIIPAFVHDLSGHKGFQEMMSPKAYELIMQQFYRLVAQGNPIAVEAKQRAERAEVLTDKEKEGKTDKQIKELEAMYEARQQNEYIPYFLTEQVTAQEATPQERNAVKRLIDHILRAVKGWVVRTLSKYSATAGISKRVSETLDARDIQLMAERMIKDIAKYEKPMPLNKQNGMARREFLGLLGAGVGVAALGGGITLIDQSIKNNTKEAAKEKVNSLADNVYNELIKQLNKSDAFVKLAQNISTSKPSSIGKASAENGFYSITDNYRMEQMYANNEQSNLIDTGGRYKDDGTPIFVDKNEVLKIASDTRALLLKNEQKIIAIMSDAIAFVESITDKKFKKLGIKATTNTPVADILVRKKIGLKDYDTDINARVEHDNPSVVLIHPQTMANLVSPNEKARLHAFQTLAHELSHVLQNQENDVNSDKSLGVNIDTPALLKNMIGNILESGYSSSERKQQESEAFHIGYLATKARLLKEGKPLSTISKAEFLNLINASIDSFTTEQEVVDSFYRNVTFLDAAQFSKTEQAQFDRLLAKADKMIAEQGKLLAPNGKPSKLNRVQWAQVRTDNFKAWFGNWENDPANASKVVDENGEPLVVYRTDFEVFNKFDKRKARQGFFFTSSKKVAEFYGSRARDFFLNINNPLVTPQALPNEKNITDIKNTDFDGIHNQGAHGANEFIVATSTQIKSATENNGEFSPTNPDIRFSRAEDKAKAAKDYVLDSVRIKKEVAANLNAKKELWWWHKTLGTQQNTAIQYKDFGRVYKTLQRLLQHQSSDVTDALEVAPTLLEKLDDWKDFKNQAKSIGRNISQGVKHKLTNAITDRMAVAKVIFGETLAKKPLSQTELEQKLNSQQLSMYEEARAAINVSLKNTAMSEIIRSLLQADAINFDTVEKHLNQQTGFDEFVDEMLENVGTRISNAQAELSQAKSAVRAGVKLITKAESDLVKATDKAQQKEIWKEIKLLTKTQEGLEKAEQEIKEEIARLSDMYNSISNVNDKVYQLIDEAYAPLMRFGDYALTMRDKDGKVLSFMMFETKAERNRMVNYLGTEYGNTVDLETDTMSTEDFKQFKGVTPETVALFAKELGLDKNEAYQGYLKLAIPATSALTRRIQRKGTAGFNEDIQRVLASFVMSNARYSAKNIYLAKADREISEIESGASVRDQAKKMRDNTIDPVDTFAWLRDLLFVWNLGGSVMFAFLNMTQPFLQTIPMLSQYVNTSFATKHVLRGIGVAGKAMATGNAPKGYEAEYKRAVHEGIVDPQNTFMLTGLERGGTGTTSKVWTGTKHILGLFAQMSESLNRKAVFIASLEVANAKGGAWLKQKGFDSAYDFAKDVIAQTQGVYNKANRSNWAHNPVGAPLLVFKQFSINYVEQVVRMAKNNNEGEEGKKAVLLMLFMLFSLAGGMGLPFIKDIFDVSETTAAFFGNPINIEREMRLMGKEYLGETTTGALMDGWLNKLVIGEVLGADIQSRTGMGDLIPMTNVLNPVLSPSQRVNEAASIFGAAGGLGEKAGDSIQFAANDEWGNAFINILPRFATSMVRGTEMMTTGETTDSKGRKLFDVTIGEGLFKFADSQPVRMAELSRARGLEYDDTAIQRSKIEYYKKKWVKAAQKEDMEAIEQIEQDIQEWNEDNEKYPVIFDRKRAYQTANKNDMTWGEREAKPPRGMEWTREERPDWMNEQ